MNISFVVHCYIVYLTHYHGPVVILDPITVIVGLQDTLLHYSYLWCIYIYDYWTLDPIIDLIPDYIIPNSHYR